MSAESRTNSSSLGPHRFRLSKGQVGSASQKGVLPQGTARILSGQGKGNHCSCAHSFRAFLGHGAPGCAMEKQVALMTADGLSNRTVTDLSSP